MKRLVVFSCILNALLLAPLAASSDDTIRDKTLVAWVSLANLHQQGGSALTIQDGVAFDAIVFGERARGKWMAGSDFFRRTQQDQSGNAAESAGPDTLVCIAIVYRGENITIYRNGKAYASYRGGHQQVFGKDSVVHLGLRHEGFGGGIGPLAGILEEARIYNVALGSEVIAGLAPNKPSNPKPIALWTFEDGTAKDSMGYFPICELHGRARIADGKLHLDGKSSYVTNRRPEPPEKPLLLQAGFYSPVRRTTGNMWEPWLVYHGGAYWLFHDATAVPGTGRAEGQSWGLHCLATSADGVYWKEEGCLQAVDELTPGTGVGGAFQIHRYRADQPFIMSYSVAQRKGTNGHKPWRIYFAQSHDLRKWKPLGDQHRFEPDPRWYPASTRWDTICAEPDPAGGFFALWNGDANADLCSANPDWRLVPAGRTTNGIDWECLPPVKLANRDAPNTGCEIAGLKKIGNRYFMVSDDFSSAGVLHLRVHSAENQAGPYLPTPRNHVLGPLAIYGAMNRIGDEVLLSHFIEKSRLPGNKGHRGSWHTLLKKCESDGNNLWLKWWPPNNKLKAQPVEVSGPTTVTEPHHPVQMLSCRFDPGRVAVLEGALRLPTAGQFADEKDWAHAATVKASSQLKFRAPDGYGPAKAVDGRVETLWIPDPADKQPMLELDFGRIIPVGRVRMEWTLTRQPQTRSIEVSEDGKTWRSIVSGAFQRRDVFAIEVLGDLNATARYLRIIQNGQLVEVSVYERGREEMGLFPGIFFELPDGSGEALLVDAKGNTRHVAVRDDRRQFLRLVDRETDIGDVRPVRFRIVQFGDLIEVYLNDCFVQHMLLPKEPTGRIGLIRGGGEDLIGDLKAWYARTEQAPAGSRGTRENRE